VKGVELQRAIARVETPDHRGGPREVPVSGRLELDARARFPLGALDDLRAYAARGTADVAGATIGDLDVGRLKARLDLAGGILEVADLRGRMVDRPEGGGRPQATDPPPAEGPLPRGGFRGRVRAELTGERGLQIEMEGVELPIAELLNVSPSMVPPSAPPTLRGMPIAGRLTVRADARAKGRESWDPRTWTLSGHAEMPEVSYRATAVKDVSTKLAIERGRLVLSDLSGRLGEAALRGRLGLDLAEPWSYDAELEAGDVTCRELLGLIPHAPKSTEVAGTIGGRGEARGTLQPWRMASSGQAKVAGLKVGRVPIGDVPVRWTTRGETITVTAEEHQRYGGRVSAEARVPVAGDRPIEGTIAMANVDAAELSSQAPQSWKLTGHADGQGRFRISPGKPDEHAGLPLEAEAHLTAGDLTVGGIPARSLKMTLTVHEGNPRFDLSADGLGGTIRLTGDGHLASDPKDDEVRAQVEALGLQLYELWGALGTSGPLADLRGRASVKGQGRARGSSSLNDVRAQGSVELGELIWGFDYRLGSRLQAELSKAPDGWHVGPLGGELFGGTVLGEGIWMYRGEGGRPMYGVDARVDRLMLARALSFLPEADRRLAGTGTLRVAGRTDGAIGGAGEFRVDRGFVNSLELTELRVPGEWTFSPGPSRRGSLSIRRAGGRLAGGRVGGDAQFTLGDRRDFRARLVVDDVDLRVISRDELGSRPVPGRLSGFVNVYGTDPAQPMSYRGELNFDMDQASLVDIPLLDELDRSLGSTEGGVFDDGDLHATIADRKVHIDSLTLVGPLAQVHATGTLDFDGRLNLEVVVNKNRGIPESGQAMLARSSNVADEIARRASQIDQVRDFISSRLMKFRITGTIRDPIANIDRSINPRAAIGFFLKTVWMSSQSR
jgi:translocation and assembly module TamB